MATLTNPKHERFAQELANGVSASQAYEKAGFRPNRPNASRLRHSEHIKQRVAELLAARQRQAEKASEKALRELAIDRRWVLERLVTNATTALENGDGSVANRALELIGIEHGMFIKRSETGGPGDFAAIQSAQDLIAQVRQQLGDKFADFLASELGADDVPPIDLATVETANRDAT
jgi:phage terminase small subunit